MQRKINKRLELKTEIPLIFIFVCLLSGIIAGGILYYRNKENEILSALQKTVLAIVRCITVFLCCFLLLSPLVIWNKIFQEKPLLLFLQDNSASIIKSSDSIKIKGDYQLRRDEMLERLGDKFDVRRFSFGQQWNESDTFSYGEPLSDYSEALSQLKDNYVYQNIGAVVMAGDGLYNTGLDPVNLAGDINYPVHTIALGDTTEFPDGRIQKISTGEKVFSGSSFNVDVDCVFNNLKGKGTMLIIKQAGQVIYRMQININNDHYLYQHHTVISANDSGLHKYTIEIVPIEEETNTINNRKEFVVDVVEDRKKVLFIAEGPDPDLGAMAGSLKKNLSYEVQFYYPGEEKLSLDDISAVVVYQLPSAQKQISRELSMLSEWDMPVFHIVGARTDLDAFNRLGTGFSIVSRNNMVEEVSAVINNDFSLFELQQFIPDNFPPLLVPFADFAAGERLSVLFSQKIRNIETGNPLWLIGNDGRRKTAILAGEGIWRWGMAEYYRNGEQPFFDQLVAKVFDYLTLEDSKEKFVVHYAHQNNSLFPVVFTAQVYNDNLEPVNNAHVTLELETALGERLNFDFTGETDNYRLEAGTLRPGVYAFTAKASFGESTYTRKGEIAVIETAKELASLKADHNLLYRISKATGGQLFYPEQLNLLEEELATSDQYSIRKIREKQMIKLIDVRILAFFLLILLTMEWFLRKFWGLY